MIVWLSPPQTSQVSVRAAGYADGIPQGKLHIALYSNNIPIGQYTDGQGTREIRASAYAQLTVYPGHQYKLTAKPIGGDKTLRKFEMHVAVNQTCP